MKLNLINSITMNKGFIYLHRNILDWKWYKNETVKTVFLHLLLKANYSNKKWEDIIIKRGSFVTGVKKLSFELDLSQNKIRLVLKKLERTNEISIKSTNRFSIVTITNYDSYQLDVNTQSQTNHNQNTNKAQTDNNQITNQSQTEHKQTTTTNKEERKKNNKNKNKENIKEINFVFPSDISKKLKDEIIKFIEYRKSIGKPYKSQMSIDNLLKDLKSVDERIAIEQMNTSIANGWVGVFNLKNSKPKIKSRYEPIKQKSIDKKLEW